MTKASAQQGVSALLNPRNVVLVGASDRTGWSGRVWQNLRRFGFPGRIFPLNPNRSEVWGVPCFSSFSELPEPPDHLALFVPAEATFQALESGAKAGARSATLYAAGFGEGGDAEGRRRADRLKDVLEGAGLAAAGPNCMGLAAGRSRFVTFADETLQLLAPSPVAVVTQSGALCTTINRAINDRGLKLAYLISCGNQTGLTFSDYIEYLADEPGLRAILCYIESVKDGPRFLAAARRARACGKTIVAVKIGGSEAGRRAALAHTGSLAGSLQVFDAFAADCGIVRSESLEEAIEALEFLAHAPSPAGSRVAAMTNSGALTSLITESAARVGADLAVLSDATRGRLAAVLGFPPANPVDTKKTLPPEDYLSCIETLASAPEVDLVLVAEELPREAGLARKESNLRALQNWVARMREKEVSSGKPIALFTPVALADSDDGRGLRRELASLPFLKGTEQALRVARSLAKAAAGSRPAGAMTTQTISQGVGPWIERARRLQEPTALNEADSKTLLSHFGLPRPREFVVEHASDAKAAAVKLGFPVVLKVISAATTHKSDAGLVMLGLADEDAVARAAAEAVRRCEDIGAPWEGLLVAEEISKGIETVIGLHRDPEMGLCLMFGMGGVTLELFKDIAFATPDLDHARARRLIAATRVARLLEGYRGAPAKDIESLVEALVCMGRLALEIGDIIESIDINPFTVCERGAFALDALVILRPAADANSKTGDQPSNV